MTTKQTMSGMIHIFGTTIMYDKSVINLERLACCIAGHEKESMSLEEAVTFAVGEYLVESGVWSID